ncbi:hypothetical protein Zmor_027090 [Zophobas morio]|uniref:Uncharacterized protein n=1 Tax=Zophobas morio TaxID=2755281 RepID=A0AA38M032_9CUCU|nr:hypothetical protein Zmor_027090 [Zophobas morio]
MLIKIQRGSKARYKGQKSVPGRLPGSRPFCHARIRHLIGSRLVCRKKPDKERKNIPIRRKAAFHSSSCCWECAESCKERALSYKAFLEG